MDEPIRGKIGPSGAPMDRSMNGGENRNPSVGTVPGGTEETEDVNVITLLWSRMPSALLEDRGYHL